MIADQNKTVVRDGSPSQNGPNGTTLTAGQRFVLSASASVTDPPPVTQMDQNGVPNVISYQMPVAYTLTGRNYLDLGLSDDDFVPVSLDTDSGSAGTLTASRGSMPGSDRGTGSSSIRPGAIVSGAPKNETAGLHADAADGSEPDPRNALIVPDSIVLGTPPAAGDTSPGPVIVLHPFQLSDDLAALTWEQVRAAQQAGRCILVYRSGGGRWHYRVVTPPPPPVLPQSAVGGAGHLQGRLRAASADPGRADVKGLEGRSAARLAPEARPEPDPGGDDGPPEVSPYVTVLIVSPNRKTPSQNAPSGGVDLSVTGRVGGRLVTNKCAYLSVNGGGESKIDVARDGTWEGVVSITATGVYHLAVRATADSADGALEASDGFDYTVTLDLPPAPPAAPSIIITTPDATHTVIAPSGQAVVTIAGTVNANGGSPVAGVSVAVDGDQAGAIAVEIPEGRVDWSTDAVLGNGRHNIVVTGTNRDGVPAPAASATVTVSQEQKFQRIERRLFLAETLALSSYLTAVGAGRLVKVFSLMAGEEAVFKVNTYSKDAQTSKNASSILDSSSTEASADFEDTVAAEQSSKRNSSTEVDLKLDATVNANWGWGSASIHGSAGKKANSAREDTTKDVRTAVAKHAEKAASNRSVTVNTEFTSQVEAGKTEDTTRTLKNINVGRVLNYTFRQVTQEVLVTLSLVGFTLVDRTVDVLLNDDGTQQRDEHSNLVIRTTVTEMGLSELYRFATQNLRAEHQPDFLSGLREILTTIPDHEGALQSAVEDFTPAVDGTPRPDLTYLRVPPGLHQDVTTTAGATVHVPGIVLSTDVHYMPVDALMVDAVLGGGNALDSYSRALQEVTIAERQAAVTARSTAVAREQLAQQIIADKDRDAAAVWQMLYPQPLNVPATINVPAAATSETAAPSGG